MNATTTDLNLVVGWIWILLGFGSGMVLGLGFHRENWLGGYASHRRRLYRLGHISFFGLGAANLLFHFTARGLPGPVWGVDWAGWGFVTGAVTMPLCCGIAAHLPRLRPLWLFSVPVVSLLGAAAITLAAVWHGGVPGGRGREPSRSVLPLGEACAPGVGLWFKSFVGGWL